MAGTNHGIPRADAGPNNIEFIDVDAIVATGTADDEVDAEIFKQQVLAPAAMIVTRPANRFCGGFIGAQNTVSVTEIAWRAVDFIFQVAQRISIIAAGIPSLCLVQDSAMKGR